MFVIVGLCNFGTSGVTTRFVYYNGRNSGTFGAGQQIMGHSDDTILIYNAYDSSSFLYNAGSNLNVSQDSVFAIYHNGTSYIKRHYGAQIDSDVTSGVYSPAIAHINAIGATNFDGKIYSLIIANYTSALDVQRLEGYICHRYGAQALLASDHPYRNEAP